MAGKSETDLTFVTKLIAASKALANANIRKCEYEEILQELTLFKNFTSLLGKPESQNVLTFNAKVVPDSIVHQMSETILITLSNNSSVFSFHHKYWEFSIEYFDGNSRHVSSWKLDEIVEQGKPQVFITKHFTTHSYGPVQVKVNASFSINWKESRFLRIVTLGSVLIDVLYFLNPGRCPTTPSHCATPWLMSNPLFSNSEEQFPPVTMFELRLDALITANFIKDVFLKDSLHRGFEINVITAKGSTAVTEEPKEEAAEEETTDNPTSVLPPSPKEVIVYFQSEKITVTVSSNSVVFKCTNAKLLCSIKGAVFKRLLMLKGIKPVCPDDFVCEKLYKLRIKLGSISRQQYSIGDLMEMYLELRDISESVQFVMLSDIE